MGIDANLTRDVTLEVDRRASGPQSLDDFRRSRANPTRGEADNRVRQRAPCLVLLNRCLNAGNTGDGVDDQLRLGTPPGKVGLVSRSGTLTYQLGKELTDMGIGQSTILGIGGDPIVGTNPRDALQLFQDDPDTDMIVMVGEIGGDEEERAADYIKEHISKPVIGYIAGLVAPEGKQMGHAGAIISGNAGTAKSKVEALEAAGVQVGKNPTEVARLVAEARGVAVPA